MNLTWEQWRELTPVEERGGLFLKRDDLFAPQGVNGSKLRQLLWLFESFPDTTKMIYSGASVKSPQLSMTAVVAHHYGVPTELIIGATTAQAAMRHRNVAMAAQFGAKFRIAPVAYNTALQHQVRTLTAANPASAIVPYGITLQDTATPDALRQFHGVGAEQVQNIPEKVTRLLVPAGSCNTLVSVMLGLATYPNAVSELYTIGIGPDKQPWVEKRLSAMGVPPGRYAHKHVNIQTNGFSTYHQEMKESWYDLPMHPTYEGKIMRWLKQHPGELRQDGTEMFWIVGAQAECVNPPFPLPKELPLCQ